MPVRNIVLTTQRFKRDDVTDRLNNLHDQVISTNWGDPVNLALDVPFWEAELDKVTAMMEPYHADPELGAQSGRLNRALDCFYACEDMRDFLIELGELGSRATGVMGTGAMAGQKVENLEELMEKVVKDYEALLAKHPEFKGKIEQSVGHGLAIMRSKVKFRYGEMHRYFY